MKSNLNLADIENLRFNAKQHWGPDKNYVFTKFDNLPFSPFSRLERLGACCDFQNIMASRTGVRPIQYSRSFAPVSMPQNAPVAQTISAPPLPAQDDGEFIQVSTTKDKKSRANYINAKNNQIERMKLQRKQQEEQESEDLRRNNKPKKVKTTPISKIKQIFIKTKFKEYTNIKVDWELIHESQKINIEQHPISNVTFSTIKVTGQLKSYDRSYDKIDPRYIKRMDTTKSLLLANSSSLKDPILISLLQQDVEDQVKKPTVYTTDALLLALMTSKKGEFPWDILVEKEGNSIILDKFEEERMNYMDFQSVNENSNILPEDEKDLNKLCVEATTVSKKFLQQATQEEQEEKWDISGGEANEVENLEEEDVAFKYVCVNIDDKMDIKVRVQLDAYETITRVDPETKETSEARVPIIVRALNEFDHATQWKIKLSTQKGSVTANEYINNISNFMKWLIQMQIAGAERLKLAYTSRVTAKDSTVHNILCVDSFSQQGLSHIIQFRPKDQWQVVKYFIDQIINEQDGRYMFVKTAFKPSVKTYLLPKENDEVDKEEEEAADDGEEEVHI